MKVLIAISICFGPFGLSRPEYRIRTVAAAPQKLCTSIFLFQKTGVLSDLRCPELEQESGRGIDYVHRNDLSHMPGFTCRIPTQATNATDAWVFAMPTGATGFVSYEGVCECKMRSSTPSQQRCARIMLASHSSVCL